MTYPSVAQAIRLEEIIREETSPVNTLIQGDAETVLRTLPDKSIHCCVTGPPYFKLRNYDDPGQIGWYESLDDYINRTVSVFRGVWRVLRDDGTAWVNYGDSYASCLGTAERKALGLKKKDLIGVPGKIAEALCRDGWYRRADNIWDKGSTAMPESVHDRPSRNHEYIFMFSKRPRYNYFEQYNEDWGRHRHSVWSINTQPVPGIHCAVFPPELARRCIRLGTSEKGVCPHCGKPWVAEVTAKGLSTSRNQVRLALKKAKKNGLTEAHIAAIVSAGITDTGQGRKTQTGTGRNTPEVIALAKEAKLLMAGYHREYLCLRATSWEWKPACKCPKHRPIPSVVLDPFAGSGTTLLAASELDRDFVGIELNPNYIGEANERVRPYLEQANERRNADAAMNWEESVQEPFP